MLLFYILISYKYITMFKLLRSKGLLITALLFSLVCQQANAAYSFEDLPQKTLLDKVKDPAKHNAQGTDFNAAPLVNTPDWLNRCVFYNGSFKLKDY